MKTLVRYWWTGMQIIVLGYIPVKGGLMLLDWLEGEVVHGYRPLWWRVVSTLIGVILFTGVPLFVAYWARQVFHHLAWLGSRPGLGGEKPVASAVSETA